MTDTVFSTTIRASSREEFDSILASEAQLVFGDEEYHIAGEIKVTDHFQATNLDGTNVTEAPLTKTWSVTLKSGLKSQDNLTAEEALLHEASMRMRKGLV